MTMEGWPEIHLTEVDGVRTVWTDVPGPLRAGLLLRVGWVDETYRTSGVTHLLEHLALFGVGRPGDHSNGQVDRVTSHFHTTGDAESVRDFFDKVGHGLREPATDRLDDERGVLAAERASRKSGVVGMLSAWRWGSQGYGLTPGEEHGIDHLTADDVRAWSARYATRGNAVLWLSGPPPAGLRLALPDGPAVPAPDPRPSVLPALPAWFAGSDDAGVALHSLVERGWPATALEHLLRSRLVDELRVRHAYAYAPQVDYAPLADGVGQLVVLSDIVSGRQTDAMRIFLDVLEQVVQDRPPTEAEVQEWSAAVARNYSEPLAPLGFAGAQAVNLVTGYPTSTVTEAREGLAGVTPEAVGELARDALASSLLAVPAGVRMTRERWVEAPSSLHEPIGTGREFRPVEEAPAEARFVAGQEGVARRFTNGTITVRADRAVGVLHWADGRRVVVADDGNRLDVEPTLWVNGEGLVSHVDRVFPASLRIDMGSRRPDEIPRPAVAPEPPPAPRRQLEVMTWVAVAGAILFWVLSLARVADEGFNGPSLIVAVIWTVVAVRRVRADLSP